MMKFRLLNEDQSLLRPIVDWIDSEWASFSGRSYDETYERYRSEFDQPKNALPFSVVAIDPDEETPMGIVSLRQRDSVDWDPNVLPWICAVYVPPFARGKGVAQALCDNMEERARKLGYTHLYLANAIGEASLYGKIGYVVYKEIDHGHGKQYLMRKSL